MLVGMGRRGHRGRRETERGGGRQQSPSPSSKTKAYHHPSPPHHAKPPKFRDCGWLVIVVVVVLGGAGVGVEAQDSAILPVSTATNTSQSWSKPCSRSHEWPVDQSTNKTLLIGFLPTRRGDRQERLGLKIPGVFTYAVEDVNNKSILPEGYKLRFEWQDTEGQETLGSKYLVDLLCRGVSAVFGPEHTCLVEGTVADGNNLPMLSYGCTNERASKLRTFARTNPSEINIIRTAVAAMKHNNWTKFSIIYSIDQESTMETLREVARKENMTINHVRVANKERLSLIFQETKNSTRIYVYLGHRNDLGEMMTAMAMAGVFQSKRERKEYLLLFIEQEEYYPNVWLEYLWGFHTESNQSQERKCQEADLLTLDEQFMMVAHRPSESHILADMVRKYNKQPPFCLGYVPSEKYIRERAIPVEDKSDSENENSVTEDPFVLLAKAQEIEDTHIPNLPTAYIFDSVMIYANAVRDLYQAAINNSENVTVEEIARDGARIKDHLRNMTYNSILGFSMTMNTNASSEGNYSVYYFSNCPNGTEDTINCTKCLHKISDYYRENSSLSATAIRIRFLDEPECGFDNSRCPQSGHEYKKTLAIALGVLLILCMFVSTYLYRNWKYEQEIVGLQWRINQMDLTMSNHVGGGSRVCEGGLYSTSSSLTSREPEEGFDYRRLEEISVV